MSQAAGHPTTPAGHGGDGTSKGKDHAFPIFVDKQKFEVTGDKITGGAVRALPTPPIGRDRDLYLVVAGGEDELVDDAESAAIKPGTKFMSVPRHIAPGRR
jgi:hypothetical protein